MNAPIKDSDWKRFSPFFLINNDDAMMMQQKNLFRGTNERARGEALVQASFTIRAYSVVDQKFKKNNVSAFGVEERKRKEDYSSSVTSSSSTGGSIFRREHANHSFTNQDDSDGNDREETDSSDDQMSAIMDQLMRGDDLGLDPHTTSVVSSICDKQEEQELRKPKSQTRNRRLRRKKKDTKNVSVTEQTVVSAGPRKSPLTTSGPAKFTLSQPVDNSSRVRPVDVTSTSTAAAASSGEASRDTVSSPSILAVATATTETTAHENRSRLAMKRSFAFLERHMAQQNIEKPLSGKQNVGSSETEEHSSLHTPYKASQDKPAETSQERPFGKEHGASVDMDKVSLFHTPPSAPEKEPQDEDTSQTYLEKNSFEDVEVKVRVIRFADEVGKPLEDYWVIGGKDDPHATGRIIIMLLSPQERKFEFIHAEFLLREKTTVTDVLYQIPKIATNAIFQSKTFINICRTRQGNTDLDNDHILQDYDMEDSELVIGVLKGYTGKVMAQCALPLLLNGKITQAVNHAKKSGRGLKYIVSSKEVEQTREEQREQTKRRLHRVHVKHRLEEAFERAEREDEESDTEEADSGIEDFDEDCARAQREVEEALAKEGCNESDYQSESSVEENTETTEGNNDEEEDEEDVVAIKAKLLNIKERKPSKFLNVKEQTTVSKKVIDDTYPDAGDFMGGRDAGLDKVVTFVHAISVAAVGIFMSMSMGN